MKCMFVLVAPRCGVQGPRSAKGFAQKWGVWAHLRAPKVMVAR
jgi:hypothetical protein